MADFQRKKNPNDCGAGWLREGKKTGTKFISLVLKLDDKDVDLSKVQLALFKNTKKTQGSKEPDYRALLSGQQSAPAAKPKPAPAAKPQTEDEEPF